MRLGAALPKDLEQVILACLAKSPDDRPASAGDLVEQLAECADAGTWTQADAQAWWCTYDESRPCPDATERRDVSRSVLEVALD